MEGKFVRLLGNNVQIDSVAGAREGIKKHMVKQ
jgi:hypothetical protein